MTDFNAFFDPRSVAVIGASRKKDSIGEVIMHNFIQHFRGKSYPVNPNAKQILGKKCYRTITDVPGSVDMAVIAVPAKFVPQVMRECAQKRVPAAVIITSGFSEVGNHELEEEITRIARTTGPRVIGVNCLGVFDSKTDVDTLFLPRSKMDRPKRGNVAFISQSGAVGSIVLDWIASRGIGMSKFVSYGNATDLNDYDFIEFLGRDANTKVICSYMEGTKDGRKLMAAAKKAKKPIIVLKAGRTNEGTSAVSSHTGSLAGADAVYDAAFHQSNIIRANDIEEMFDFARVFSKQPPARGKKVMIITNGGGFGVLATDAIIQNGLELAKWDSKSRKALKKVLPWYAPVHNPMDLVGDANAARYKVALDCAMDDPNVDAVLCITLFQTTSLEPDVVKHVINFSKRRKKPIVGCAAGGKYTHDNMKRLEDAGVPMYEAPHEAAKVLGVLAKYGGRL